MWEWLKAKFGGEAHPRGYEIIDQMFEGAFSDIYRAVQKKTQREVALKILTEAGEKIARLLDEDSSTMWEGELLASLQHPNIVKGLDYGQNSDYWLVMEIVESNLADYIGRCDNEEEENEILDILSQIIAAIGYLHERELVHRDICLGNILLSADGKVKLIDFGMTVPVGSKVVKGRVGTPSYMAPEMIKRWQYTPATDIYSFGIVMYELITGKKPFRGKRREQRMTHSLNLHPTPPSEEGYYCSEDVEKLLMRCISKDPEKRPESAREVSNALCVMR
jgi:serine/threonine protein kinase